MSKNLLFYTIGDYMDADKYCKRKSFIPLKTITKKLDDLPFEVVVQYRKGGDVYDVFGETQCYSGYMITLMKTPRLSYEELLNVALTSKNSDERAGAIGMILKQHHKEFKKYLLEIKQTAVQDRTIQRQIVRLVTYIYDWIRVYTGYLEELNMIYLLCNEIKQKYNPQFKYIKWW